MKTATTKKTVRADGRSPLVRSRRQMYQEYSHLMKVKASAFDDRAAARKARKLDEVQLLTEAIYHTSKAMAFLNTVARHRFGCDLEDLEVYK